MKDRPADSREIPGGTQNDTDQKPEMNDAEPAPRVRAVPNIPIREQDPLPERPAREGSSRNNIMPILLIIGIILLLIFLFLKN